MKKDDDSNPTNVNEIIKNFSSMIREFAMKETEWQISKENYEKKIAELEGELKAHENINIDLLKRIRMLEYELARERGEKEPIDKNTDNKNEDLFKDLQYPNLIKEEDLKFLEDSADRPSLLTVLQNIGIDENLANNLFTDFELNKNELENLIKKDIEEKIMKSDINNNIGLNIRNNNINNKINNNNIKNNIQINETSNMKSSIINNNINNSNIHYSFNLNNFIELRGHFDEVRKLSYLENINSLVSISEDCLIKVWSLNNIDTYNNNENEPYLNLRGHTGPLFCLEHGRDNLIYTGGCEGVIQIWNILPYGEISPYGSSDDMFNLNIGFFQENEDNEIYWDLKHHPKQNLLISLSSDGNISFWETTSAEEFIHSFSKGKFKWLKNTKNKKSSFIEEISIPISCDFMKQDTNKLIVGFNDATISLLDINKNSFISHYNLLNKNINNRLLYQADCFACRPNIAYTGCEDGSLKILDFNEKEIITDNITIHGDAVTSLNLYKDLYLFSVSHDTTIKIWDTRKINEPINTVVGSQKKWDESMWDSLLIEKDMLFCVACADSTIKLYKI